VHDVEPKKEGDPMNGSQETMGRPGETQDRGVLDAARETLNTGYDKTSRTMREAVTYSRNHPIKASLIAIGAGLGLGMLLLPSRARRRRAGLAGALRYMLRR